MARSKPQPHQEKKISQPRKPQKVASKNISSEESHPHLPEHAL